MSTTTLRLPDELRARIARLAKKSGKTAHSVMLDAIAQKVEEEELRASFHGEADTRFAEMIESGAGIPWHDMRAYLKTRASGKAAQAPRTRPWRR
ncbi:MAG: CopG family ribbon-helix-helix protein [Terriglobales bacterium]